MSAACSRAEMPILRSRRISLLRHTPAYRIESTFSYNRCSRGDRGCSGPVLDGPRFPPRRTDATVDSAYEPAIIDLVATRHQAAVTHPDEHRDAFVSQSAAHILELSLSAVVRIRLVAHRIGTAFHWPVRHQAVTDSVAEPVRNLPLPFGGLLRPCRLVRPCVAHVPRPSCGGTRLAALHSSV